MLAKNLFLQVAQSLRAIVGGLVLIQPLKGKSGMKRIPPTEWYEPKSFVTVATDILATFLMMGQQTLAYVIA
jgi:hypothetical protein